MFVCTRCPGQVKPACFVGLEALCVGFASGKKVMLLCWGQEEAEDGWQKHSVEFADLMIFVVLMGI